MVEFRVWAGVAIGSEPGEPGLDSRGHWRRAMQGHAAANLVPVIASNRIGAERGRYGDIAMAFYGTSFIADHTGAIAAELDDSTPGIAIARFDLDAVREYRESWGVWRDRRPEFYRAILSHDGAA